MEIQGRIIKGIGGFYYIETENGLIECRARGKFRKEKITPMVGDLVKISLLSEEKGSLDEILPRKNFLIRPAIANIDKLFIVVSDKEPEKDYFLIDKITVYCELRGIDAAIVINKIDAYSGDEIEKIYKNAGFQVFKTCAPKKEGIAPLLFEIKGKLSVFAGMSGVGKSSLLNALDIGSNMEVGTLSEKIARGKHTTRHSELFALKEGGYIADTPGFGSLDPIMIDKMTKEMVKNGFREFEGFSSDCKFLGCSHIKEKGCAILNALSEGRVEKTRYESYLRLCEIFKDVKEWEI